MKKIMFNIFLIMLLGIMSISLYKVLNSHQQEQNEVSKLEEILRDQKKTNTELNSQLNYYKSTEYIEKVSRDDLNLAKNGEYVVVLPTNSVINGVNSSSGNSNTKNNNDSNIMKWIRLIIY